MLLFLSFRQIYSCLASFLQCCKFLTPESINYILFWYFTVLLQRMVFSSGEINSRFLLIPKCIIIFINHPVTFFFLIVFCLTFLNLSYFFVYLCQTFVILKHAILCILYNLLSCLCQFSLINNLWFISFLLMSFSFCFILHLFLQFCV